MLSVQLRTVPVSVAARSTSVTGGSLNTSIRPVPATVQVTAGKVLPLAFLKAQGCPWAEALEPPVPTPAFFLNYTQITP